MNEQVSDADELTMCLRSFHRSLRAAVIAGAKLDLGAPRSHADSSHAETAESTDAKQLLSGAKNHGGIATISKLDRLEPLLDDLVRQVRTSTDSPRKQNEEPTLTLPASYVSAFRIFQQTGRIDLVLDSLSLPSTIAGELASTVRPVWFYLALMLVVATAGITVFATISAPRVAAIREDLALMPAATTSDSWFAAPDINPLLILLPLLTIGMITLGLTTKGSATIVSGLGGRRYRTDRSRAVLANIERAREDADDKDYTGRRSRLSLMSAHAFSLAQHRLTRLRIGLPTLLVAVLGGGGALFYCLILFGPLIWLIHDLATIAAEQGMWP